MRLNLTTEQINTGPQALVSLQAQGAWLHVCAACVEAGGEVPLALLKLRHPDIKEPLRELHDAGVIAIDPESKRVTVPSMAHQINKKTQATNAAQSRHKRERGPTMEQVAEFAKGEELNVDVAKFHDYYTARKWKTSQGKPVNDWQGMLRKWANNARR